MVRPDQKREAVEHLQRVALAGQDHPLSQRRACRVLHANRRSVRRERVQDAKDQPLKEQMQWLSQKHPRYGYRRIHALLRRDYARDHARDHVRDLSLIHI